jgi:hypothetical protein
MPLLYLRKKQRSAQRQQAEQHEQPVVNACGSITTLLHDGFAFACFFFSADGARRGGAAIPQKGN